DIAGRIGKVTFDVGNDTQGSHMAWPTFIWTDQPVPAPNGGLNAAIPRDYPRNSIGFNLALTCTPQQPCNLPAPNGSSGRCHGVDMMYMSTNWVVSDINFTAGG